MTTPKLSPLAIHLLKQVRQQILEKPETYAHRRVQNECGTVLCVAGHLCLNAGLNPPFIMADAAKVLGLFEDDCLNLFNPALSDSHSLSADILWDAYCSHNEKERAQAGARIIDAFIEKYS